MQKIAVIISGHTRDFERTLPGLSLLVKSFDADVFISSYTRRGTGIRFWQGQDKYSDTLTKEDYELIGTSLMPIKSHYDEEIISPFPFNKFEFKNKLISTEGVYKMFYKFWHVNELKNKYEHENNFTYPLVIRTRFDNEYLKLDLQAFHNNTVYTAKADISSFITDTFFISDSGTMNKIAEIKNEICTSIIPSDYYNAEHMLTDYIIKKNIKIDTSQSIQIRLRDKLFT